MDEPKTALVRDFVAGRAEVAELVVRLCYPKAVQFATYRLRNRKVRVVYDAEDAANSALARVCHAAARGQLRSIDTRDRFWSLVRTVVSRRVLAAADREGALKRGGESASAPNRDETPVDLIASPGLGPDLLAIGRIEVARLIEALGDPLLRRIAVLKFEGFTNAQIVEAVGRPGSTVERKLRVIREIWGRGG